MTQGPSRYEKNRHPMLVSHLGTAKEDFDAFAFEHVDDRPHGCVSESEPPAFFLLGESLSLLVSPACGNRVDREFVALCAEHLRFDSGVAPPMLLEPQTASFRLRDPASRSSGSSEALRRRYRPVLID